MVTSVARGKFNAPAGIEVNELELNSINTSFLTLSNVPTGIDVILLLIKLKLTYSVNFLTSSAGNLVRALLFPSITIPLVFKSKSFRISLILESTKALELHLISKPKPSLAVSQVHGEIAVGGGQSSAEVDVVKTTYVDTLVKLKQQQNHYYRGEYKKTHLFY